LGEAIRRIRKKQGLSQEELAYRASVDRAYVSGIERGGHNVAVINLCKLAKALDVTVAAIFTQAKI
jgi:transcriptional regulator with XRE-family HTH domain